MLPNLRPRTGPLLAGLAIAALLLAQVVAVWPFTVDDAYITLRYARQLAAGHGPVYQPGTPPAEGYSTFLWMALLSLPHLLRLDAVLIAKGIGVLATMALLALVAWWGARIVGQEASGAADAPTRAHVGAPGAAAAVAAIALASYPASAVHAVSGMESALFALLLLGFLVLCAEATRDPEGRRAAWLGPAALAVGLTRPEGNLAAVLALTVTVALVARPARRRLIGRLLLFYVAPGAIYFIWRWSYYGALWPLPFYIKLGGLHGLPGAQRVWGFLATFGIHLGLLVAFALVRPPRTLWPALAAAGGLLLFFLFPAHVMGYHARYLFPVAPLLCVLAGLGAIRLAGWLRARRVFAGGNASVAAYALGIALALSLLSDSVRTAADRRLYAAGLERAHVALGRRLASLPRGTLAIADAGAVPYFSDWRTIDLLGLNDRHIATTSDHDPAYVIAARPDVVVFTSSEPDRLVPFFWDPWEMALYQACARQGMEVVARYEFQPNYFLWVMARPGGAWGYAPAPTLRATPSAPPPATPDRRRG